MGGQGVVGEIGSEALGVVELVVRVAVLGVVGTGVSNVRVEVRDVGGETTNFRRGSPFAREVLSEVHYFGELHGSCDRLALVSHVCIVQG